MYDDADVCTDWLLYTFPSIASIRFHSHPASLDKEKIPVTKLPFLSCSSKLALQWGRAVYTYYVYDLLSGGGIGVGYPVFIEINGANEHLIGLETSFISIFRYSRKLRMCVVYLIGLDTGFI